MPYSPRKEIKKLILDRNALEKNSIDRNIDLIDKEIELLNNINKKKKITKKYKKKVNEKDSEVGLADLITNEQHSNKTREEELIKRYLDNNEIQENQIIDKYFGDPDDDFVIKSKENKLHHKIGQTNLYDNQEEMVSESNSVKSPINHQQFTSFLEEQRKKMSLPEKNLMTKHKDDYYDDYDDNDDDDVDVDVNDDDDNDNDNDYSPI